MISSISKPKIPSKYAYVIKTSQLENTLADNDITIYIDLVYWLPQVIGSIFEVYFWLPNENIAYNRLYIRAGALLKEDVFTARAKVTAVVLPEFVVWIKKILALPSDSPHLSDKLRFEAVINGDILKIHKL